MHWITGKNKDHLNESNDPKNVQVYDELCITIIQVMNADNALTAFVDRPGKNPLTTNLSRLRRYFSQNERIKFRFDPNPNSKIL